MEPKDPFNTLNIKNVSKIIESKETDDIVSCLEKLEIHAQSIGEGDSSEVFVAENPKLEKVCLKRIKKTPKMLCNDIDTEHKYQISAHKAGVRTPLPLISIESADGKKYLIMERIFGYSVGETIEDISLLPDIFDIDIFAKALESNVSKMHDAQIHHRSLHMQNIMIESSTGLPVILDFGTATTGSDSDFTYEESVLVINPKTGKYEQKSGNFEHDTTMVKNMCSTLRKTIQQKAVANLTQKQ